MNAEKLRIPKQYSKIAKHYLKIKRLTKDELSDMIDAIDDIHISYDGKSFVTIRGSKGSYIGERKDHQIDWKELIIKRISAQKKTEENIEPRKTKRFYKKRTFRRKPK